MSGEKPNSAKNKNISWVERQRQKSDIWGAYWSQCFDHTNATFSLFCLTLFFSFWNRKNYYKDSDVVEGVLFPLKRAASLRKFGKVSFFSFFVAIFSNSVRGPDGQLDGLHTWMSLSLGGITGATPAAPQWSLRRRSPFSTRAFFCPVSILSTQVRTLQTGRSASVSPSLICLCICLFFL